VIEGEAMSHDASTAGHGLDARHVGVGQQKRQLVV
jgi:hypothetical protein